jgi:hypothetical protein
MGKRGCARFVGSSQKQVEMERCDEFYIILSKPGNDKRPIHTNPKSVDNGKELESGDVT